MPLLAAARRRTLVEISNEAGREHLLRRRSWSLPSLPITYWQSSCAFSTNYTSFDSRNTIFFFFFPHVNTHRYVSCTELAVFPSKFSFCAFKGNLKKKKKKNQSGRSSPKCQRLLHCSLKPAPTNLSFFPLDILSLLASHFTRILRESTSRKDVASLQCGGAAPVVPAKRCPSVSWDVLLVLRAHSSTSSEPRSKHKPRGVSNLWDERGKKKIF